MTVHPGLCQTSSETQVVGCFTHRLKCKFKQPYLCRNKSEITARSLGAKVKVRSGKDQRMTNDQVIKSLKVENPINQY